jgi:dihydroorotase-like cyclic amidohydrolase
MAVTSWSKQVFDEMEIVVKTYGINTFKHFMAYKGALMVNDDELYNSFARCAHLGHAAGPRRERRRRGALAAGSDADLVVWDPAATKTITAKSQLSRIDYNVFEGVCKGAPVVTLSRGTIVGQKATFAPRRAMDIMSSGRRSLRSMSQIRPGNSRPRRKPCGAPT